MVYSQVSYKAFHSLRQSGHHNMGRLKSAYQYRSEAAEGCPLTHQYTLAEARALFEGAGLHIIDMRKAHIFVWDVEEYKQGNFVKSREWEGVSDERIKSLEPELGQHILIRARRDMNR
jgi:hypothetical protein